MNKSEAFEQAKSIWPHHEPVRTQGSCLTGDGLAVIVCGYEQRTAVVIYGERDLMNLQRAAEAALANIAEKKVKR